MMHRRTTNPDAGKRKAVWWPLLFTPFIAFVFLDPYQRHASPLEWTLTSLAVLVFLGLFAYALASGVERKSTVLAAVVAVSIIGLVMAPFNAGAALFIIYSTAFVPSAVGGEIAATVTVIGLILAAVGLESWLLRLTWYFWGYSFGYALVLGTANTYAVRRALSLERIAKADERERIARDLHDVLGHTLSLIVIKAELAGRLLDRDRDRARTEMGDVERIARAALAEVRQTISGYLAGGLETEVERAKAALETAGIALDAHVARVSMEAAHERVLSLVLREAVTNVVRHSHATSCRLVLQEADGNIRLDLEDDGRGGERSEGHGIRGMRERIEAIGGSLSYTGSSGTRLMITLPIATSEAGQSR